MRFYGHRPVVHSSSHFDHGFRLGRLRLPLTEKPGLSEGEWSSMVAGFLMGQAVLPWNPPDDMQD